MAEPKYKISIQPGYVLVEDPPNYDVVWTEQPPKLRAMSAACSEAGYNKALIRGSKSNVKLTGAEIFKLGVEVAKLNLLVAVVTQHDTSKDTERFIENVVANRGLPIQFFENEQDAKDWLGV